MSDVLQRLYIKVINNDAIEECDIYELISHDDYDKLHENILTREMLQVVLEHGITTNITPLPDYIVKTRESTLSFYSREYNSIKMFRSNTTTYTLGTSLTLDHNNIRKVSRFIRNVIDEQSGVKPYLISLYDSRKSVIFNKRPSDVDIAMEEISEQYADSFTLDKIVIRRSITKDRYNNQHALSGEGIPVKYDKGFWLIDISRTKKYCLLQVYITWSYYSKYTKLPNNIEMTKLKKKLAKTVCNDDVFDIKMLHDISPVNIVVISSQDELYELDPYDTISNIVCYISCNHAVLVTHDNYMTKDDIIWQEYRSRCTFVQPIRYIPKSSISSMLITGDIECYRDVSRIPRISHIPLVASIYNGYNARQFVGSDCIIKMLKYLSTLDNPIIWMHNAGNYDSHIILEHALFIADKSRYNPIDIADLNGSIISMKIHLSNGNSIIIKDSYKLLPASLSKLSQNILGQDKLDLDIVNATYDDIISEKYLEYNVRDSVLLHNILNKISDIIPNITSYSTLPSYAKHLFYTNYYDSRYIIYVLPMWVDNMLRKGYKGGRNEVYKRGVIKGPVYIYDVNSMYPYSGTNNLPYGKPIYNANIKKIATKEYMMRNFGFHIVSIIFTNINVRPLHGINYNNKLVFPICYNVKCMLFSEEIIYGIDIGNKYYVHESIVFEKHPVMRDLFTYIYHNKETSTDDTRRMIWKLIANSSYGFMGFNKYNRTVLKCYGNTAADHVISSHTSGNSIYTRYDNLDIYLVNEKTHALLSDTNVAIASAITSYARCYIHNIMSDVEKYGGKILYCDTDSIITDICLEDVGSKYIGTNMGMLKREYNNNIIDEIIIATTKVYGIKMGSNYITKIKGIDVNRLITEEAKIFCNRSHDKLYNKLKHSIIHNIPIDIISSNIIRSRDSKIIRDTFLEEVISCKTISLEYSKGLIDNKGNVRPFILKNISNV